MHHILLLIFPIVIQIWSRFQLFHCNSNCNSTVPSFHHRHYEIKWLEFASNTYIHTWPHCLQKTTRAMLLQTIATNIDSFRGFQQKLVTAGKFALIFTNNAIINFSNCRLQWAKIVGCFRNYWNPCSLSSQVEQLFQRSVKPILHYYFKCFIACHLFTRCSPTL